MRLRPALLVGALLLSVAQSSLALPVPTQGVRPAQAQGAPQAFQQGMAALQADRPEEARQAFNRALRADPQLVEAMLGLAELGFKARNDAETLKWLQQAERQAPQRADVQILLGRFYLARQQPDKGEAALRKAVALDAKGLPQRLVLAEALLSRRAASEALPLLQEAQRLDPKQARVALLIGAAQAELGASAEAEKALQQAAQLDPKSAQPWLIRARLQKSATAALPLIEQALQRQPDSYEALMLRAGYQNATKDGKGARDSLRRAAQANPKAADPLVQLGLLAEADGQRNEARRHYLAAIERDAHQPVALNNLVMMGLADKEDPGRLEMMARRAVKALPDNPQVLDTLAQTLRARKDKAGALAAGQQAVKLAPKDAAMLLHLAELQQWNGDRKAARQSAEGVLALQAQGKEADKARALLTRL